jgi:hypothetical protein
MWPTFVGNARRKVRSSTPHTTRGGLTYDARQPAAGSVLRELHHRPERKGDLAPQHSDYMTIASHRVRLPVWEPRQLDHFYDPPVPAQSSQRASDVGPVRQRAGPCAAPPAQNACVASATKIVTLCQSADHVTYCSAYAAGCAAASLRWRCMAWRTRSSRIGTSSVVRSIVAIGGST